MKRDFYLKFGILSLLFAIIVLGAQYTVFELLGWNEKSFLIAAFATIVLISVFGILIAKFALNPLWETNELLDRLLKDTLHELNIPVATIIANASMLKKNIDDPKKLKRLERIQKASDQLLRLYKEMDYFIKREIQKVDYEIFNLKELVEERITVFEDIKKDIKISYDLDDLDVKAQKVGFAKVIDNIISNSIKYNKPSGSVFVVLKEKKLIIEDTGIGMDESEIVKIFERYYRAQSGKSGYGIGLNIVKSYCDEHKIKIGIDSKKGRGTKITLDLKEIAV
ncbi:sensor histidine kinase [Nitrosophilus alvini]|uniref:sensor histidine kinase n=1 Tax=Nitrosophilus alvini TaxID=2714855 RepID=UPI001909C2A0|nr:HAMP domain-containing sensor histidine kinase [Nitrosophilus alvini]